LISAMIPGRSGIVRRRSFAGPEFSAIRRRSSIGTRVFRAESSRGRPPGCDRGGSARLPPAEDGKEPPEPFHRRAGIDRAGRHPHPFPQVLRGPPATAANAAFTSTAWREGPGSPERTPVRIFAFAAASPPRRAPAEHTRTRTASDRRENASPFPSELPRRSWARRGRPRPVRRSREPRTRAGARIPRGPSSMYPRAPR